MPYRAKRGGDTRALARKKAIRAGSGGKGLPGLAQTGQQGGIRGLAKRIGTTAETMYEWFRDEREPSLDYLREMARELGVTRSRIVAAMDGEAPVVGLDSLTREAVREEVVATLRDLGRL